MIIIKNQNLITYNTFRIKASAENFIRIYNEERLIQFIKQKHHPNSIIGGGSNILLTRDVQGYVLRNEIKGIKIIDEDDDYITVEVGAGENWHQWVMWSLSHDLGGLENLSLIPGTVGAAPMQNIGAYGVEQESCFVSLSAINLKDGTTATFNKSECQFGYRESIFKHAVKNQFFIINVTYRLKKHSHILHMEYGAIQQILQQNGIKNPSIRDVSNAVIEIRKSKLPDPLVIGNAGSFFKNPVVTNEIFDQLKNQYADIPSYKVNDLHIKIPAGWLIEKAGFKGKTFGHVGVHKDQALVLVNYGEGKGHEIKELASIIQEAVQNQFGISIYPEVNVW